MELDSQQREVNWVTSPWHVGIQGNEEADSLAEIGQLSSPLLANSLANSARNSPDCCPYFDFRLRV